MLRKKTLISAGGSGTTKSNPTSDDFDLLNGGHRVSEESLAVMFGNELDYCLKSFQAFTAKGGRANQTSAQYKLVINQFLSLFEKYDRHLDELILLEKYVEAGEKLLPLKGFHLLAKESCLERALYRMEGSTFGTSMASSLNLLTQDDAEVESSFDDMAFKRGRRTFGHLLATFFSLKHRIAYGINLANFLSIVEFDYSLKSLDSLEHVYSIIKKYQESVEMTIRTGVEESLWIAFHGIYHCVEIAKFAIEQTNNFEILDYVQWIPEMLLENDIYRTCNGSQFHLKVFEEFYQMYALGGNIQNCHELMKFGVDFFTEIYNQAIQNDTKDIELVEMAIKRCQFKLGALYAGGLMTNSVDQPSNQPLNLDHVKEEQTFSPIEWVELAHSTSGVLFNDVTKTTYFLFQYKKENFPTEFKAGLKEDLKDSLDNFLFYLQVPVTHDTNPPLIDVPAENVKKQAKAEEEPKIEEKPVVIAPSKKGKGGYIHSPQKATPVPEKKKIIHEESEDSKMKRSWTSDLMLHLSMFEKKSEKLNVAVQTLSLLMPQAHRIKFNDKLEDKKEFMALALIDHAFDILQPYLKKSQHFNDQKVELPYLNMSDIFSLTRYLYQFKQWSRLNQAYNILQTNAKNATMIHTWLKELNIRIAAVNFTNSIQSGRKVFFHGPITEEPELQFTPMIKLSASILCLMICKTIESSHHSLEKNSMALEGVNLLWGFIEPLFRNIRNAEDLQSHHNLHSELTYMLLCSFIHNVYSRISVFPDSNVVLYGLGISMKLSYMYESAEMYEKALKVLSAAEKNIGRAREIQLGSSYAFVDSVTVDPSFLPNIDSSYLEKEDSFSKLRREFACVHVDIICSVYRCWIKDFRKSETVYIAQKQQENLKLKHVLLNLSKAVLSSEEFVKKKCGNDPTRRALFLMSILREDPNLSDSERKKLLKRIREYLTAAREAESVMLNQNGNSDAPLILSKTATTISIQLDKTKLKGRKHFSINCVLSGILNERNRSDVIGSLIEHYWHPNISVNIILYGLKPNCRYEISYNSMSSSGNYKSTSIAVLACLPLHLPLCWTYFSELANSYMDEESLFFAREVIQSHIISFKDPIDTRTKSTIAASEFQPMEFFRLCKDSAKRLTGMFVSGYAQAIFSLSKKYESQFQLENSPKDVIAAQKLRVEICLDLLIAAELASIVKNRKLELLCIIKAYYQIIPFLKLNLSFGFITSVLYKCHSALISLASAFENDRSKGLGEYLVPVTYYLVEILIKYSAEQNNSLINRLIIETTTLINVSAASVETKIHGSSAIEQFLLGYNYKPVSGNAKKGAAHYLQEHGFHGIISLSKTPAAGLPVRKQFDYFFEQLELMAVKNKIGSNTIDLTKKATYVKKTLEGVTSLKEIYQIFVAGGPDIIAQELSKFKKNHRYVELISEVIEWAFEKELYESSTRLSYDLEDWVDRRNQSIIKMQELIDNSVKEKKEVILKRKRRLLFVVNKSLENESKDVSNERGRDKTRRSSATAKIEKQKATKEKTEPHPTSTVTNEKPSRPKSAGSISLASNSSLSSDSSRSRSRERSGANTSIRSHSPGQQVVPKVAVRKRKALSVKLAFYSGMSPQEKEKTEAAIKVLDNKLGPLWKRRRYERRLRAISEYETPWRANAFNARGRALLQQLKKESKNSAGNEAKDFQNTEWLEFRKSGGLILKIFSKEHSQNNFDLYQAQNAVQIDALQAFVQSVVLAGRAQEHLKVLKFAKVFWNAVKSLMFQGRLDSEFWRLTIWKGFMIIGETILTSLNAVAISRQEGDNPFYPQKEFDDKQVNQTKLPVKDARDLYLGTFIASWTDKYQNHQSEPIDLYFCGEFLLLMLEMLNAANLPNRVVQFGKQVQALFDDAHGSIIAPLLKGVSEHLNTKKVLKDVRPNAASGVSSSIQLRATARYFCSTALSFSASEQKLNIETSQELKKAISEAEYYYNEAIKASEVENDPLAYGTLYIELGDFYFYNKKYSGSTSLWVKGVESIIGKTEILKTWRSVFGFDSKRKFSVADIEKSISLIGNAYYTILCANTIAKIARFVYTKNHDMQSDLIWLSSHLIFSSISNSIASPDDYYSYMDISCSSFLTSNALFNDKYQLDTIQFFDNLLFLSSELIQYDMLSVSFPLLALAENISCMYLDSVPAHSKVQLLKAEVYAANGNLQKSFELLYSVSKRFTFKKKVEEPSIDLSFDNTVYPVTIGQYASIKNFLGLALADKAKAMLPRNFAADFDLCKIRVILNVFKWANIDYTTFVFKSKEKENKKKDAASKLDLSNLGTDSNVETLDTLLNFSTRLINAIRSNLDIYGEPSIFDEEDPNSLKEWENYGYLHVQVVHCLDMISKTFLFKKMYRDSLHWAMQIRELVVSFRPQQFLYEMITAYLGKRFFFVNREIIAQSHLGCGRSSIAFKILDEPANFYDKWKSTYIMGLLAIAKFHFLDAHGIEDHQENLKYARERLRAMVTALKDHPYSLAILPKLYDCLIEQADNLRQDSLLFKSVKERKELWNEVITDTKTLKSSDTTYSLAYSRKLNQDSFFDISIETMIRESRILRIEAVENHELYHENMSKLLQLLKGKYSIHKSLATHICYNAGLTLFYQRNSVPGKALHPLAVQFIQEYLARSEGMEYIDSAIAQNIYLMLLTLEIELDDTHSMFDYLRKAFLAPTMKISMLEKNKQLHEMPLEYLIEFNEFKHSQSSVESVDIRQYDEPIVTDRSKDFLESSITVKDIQAYRNNLEKELLTWRKSQNFHWYGELCSKWTKLNGYLRENSMFTSNSSLDASRERKRGILFGWLSQDAVFGSYRPSISFLQYISSLEKRFGTSDDGDRQDERAVFQSSRSNIVPPPKPPKDVILAVAATIKKPKTLDSFSVSTDNMDGSKKKPRSGPSSAAKEKSSSAEQLLEIKIVRNIPDNLVGLIWQMSKSLVIALGNFEITLEDSFKTEAQEIWITILSIMGRVMSQEDTDPTGPKPGLSIRNGLLMERLLDPSLVSGWFDTHELVYELKSPYLNVDQTNGGDKTFQGDPERDVELFKWLVERTPEFGMAYNTLG